MGKFRLLILATLVATISACGDDGTEPTDLPPVFKNLSQKNDVLDNFEAAYNKRRVDQYDALLDPAFTFYLSIGDVSNGLPDQWDRAEEVLVNTHVFDPSYPAHPCQSIDMDVRSEEGISWIESDSPLTPGEKWYTTTVHYDFKFEIAPNTTYIPLTGAKASFTVRDSTPKGSHGHHWQLVELRDVGDTLLNSRSSEMTGASTLGGVKALYR